MTSKDSNSKPLFSKWVMESLGVTVCALSTSNSNVANHIKISKAEVLLNSIEEENTIILFICKENGIDANINPQRRICEYFDISERYSKK